jgi:hypothetical protein
MGLSISGKIINKKITSDFVLGKEIFDCKKLKFVNEISFESAISGRLRKTDAAVFLLNEGTIIFYGDELARDLMYVGKATNNNHKGLSFDYSETSGAIAYYYSENGENLRMLMSVNNKVLTQSGEPLEIEKGIEHMDMLPIFSQEILNENFLNINLNLIGRQVRPLY